MPYSHVSGYFRKHFVSVLGHRFKNLYSKDRFWKPALLHWKRRLGVDRKLKRRNDISFQKRPNVCERGHGKTIIIHTRKC